MCISKSFHGSDNNAVSSNGNRINFPIDFGTLCTDHNSESLLTKHRKYNMTLKKLAEDPSNKRLADINFKYIQRPQGVKVMLKMD
jgi:hypothetical protein